MRTRSATRRAEHDTFFENGTTHTPGGSEGGGGRESMLTRTSVCKLVNVTICKIMVDEVVEEIVLDEGNHGKYFFSFLLERYVDI